MSKIIAKRQGYRRVPWERSEGEDFLHGPNGDQIPVYTLIHVSGRERTEVGFVERRYEVKSETKGKWMYEEDWYESPDGRPAAEDDLREMGNRAQDDPWGNHRPRTRVVWALYNYSGGPRTLCRTLREARERV